MTYREKPTVKCSWRCQVWCTPFNFFIFNKTNCQVRCNNAYLFHNRMGSYTKYTINSILQISNVQRQANLMLVLNGAQRHTRALCHRYTHFYNMPSVWPSKDTITYNLKESTFLTHNAKPSIKKSKILLSVALYFTLFASLSLTCLQCEPAHKSIMCN